MEPGGCAAAEDGSLTPRSDGVLGASVGQDEPDTALFDPFFVRTVNGQASSASVDLTSVALNQNAAIGVTAVDIESDAGEWCCGDLCDASQYDRILRPSAMSEWVCCVELGPPKFWGIASCVRLISLVCVSNEKVAEAFAMEERTMHLSWLREYAGSSVVPKLWGLALVIAISLFAPSALAQFGEYDIEEEPIGSSEWASFELHVGVYQPDRNDAFGDFFSGDRGPKVGGELDLVPFRIPYVGRVGMGIQPGWARYSGNTLDDAGQETDESTSLKIYPIPIMGVLQIDTLAREFSIPFVFTGKIGLDLVPWSADGGIADGSGFAIGLRWGAQVALELDFIEPKKARSLDDEWGINHTYIFFEAYGSTAKDSGFELGDNFAWDMGLGFVF